MRMGKGLALWLLVLGVSGCGDNQTPGSSFNAVGGNAGAGGGAGAGWTSPISLDGGGGRMNDGSSDGARDAASVNPSLCTYGTARLEGTWSGAPFMRSFMLESKFAPYDNGAAWQFFYQLDADGFLVMRG